MAKLPSEFVKPPTGKPAARRRRAKASLLDPEAARALLREVIVRLTEVEYRWLEEARAASARDGEEVTLEQMIHRIIAEWSAHRTEAAGAHARPVEGIFAHLRKLAAAPLSTWRQLRAAALRRLSGQAIHPA